MTAFIIVGKLLYQKIFYGYNRMADYMRGAGVGMFGGGGGGGGPPPRQDDSDTDSGESETETNKKYPGHEKEEKRMTQEEKDALKTHRVRVKAIADMIAKKKAQIKRRNDEYRAGAYDRPQRFGRLTTSDDNRAAHQAKTAAIREEIKELQRAKKMYRSIVASMKHKVARSKEGVPAVIAKEAAEAARKEAVYAEKIKEWRKR
jgi:hypothetical protein